MIDICDLRENCVTLLKLEKLVQYVIKGFLFSEELRKQQMYEEVYLLLLLLLQRLHLTYKRKKMMNLKLITVKTTKWEQDFDYCALL